MEKEGVGIDKGEECCLLGINMADHPPFQGFLSQAYCRSFGLSDPRLARRSPWPLSFCFGSGGESRGPRGGIGSDLY
jgi:hypothetical protein